MIETLKASGELGLAIAGGLVGLGVLALTVQIVWFITRILRQLRVRRKVAPKIILLGPPAKPRLLEKSNRAAQ